MTRTLWLAGAALVASAGSLSAQADARPAPGRVAVTATVVRVEAATLAVASLRQVLQAETSRRKTSRTGLVWITLEPQSPARKRVTVNYLAN